MSDPFLGEIKMFGGNYAPQGYAFCNGQLMPISQNTALFSLLGTAFGGNGINIFGLPDLQACAPMATGDGPGRTPRYIGETGGEPAVTLIWTENPGHQHLIQGGLPPEEGEPVPTAANNLLSGNGSLNLFSNSSSPQRVPMGAPVAYGKSLPHNNLMPYLAINFIIALVGIYPQRQ